MFLQIDSLGECFYKLIVSYKLIGNILQIERGMFLQIDSFFSNHRCRRALLRVGVKRGDGIKEIIVKISFPKYV